MSTLSNLSLTVTLRVNVDIDSYDMNYGVTNPDTIYAMVTSDVETLVNDHFDRCGVTAAATVEPR